MSKVRGSVVSRLETLRRKARAGSELARDNLAAEYRIVGKDGLAFRWWKKGADAGNGDDAVEVGYCYQHGIGVRRDLRAAARWYASASRSREITPYAKEEARYLLAVLLLAGGHDLRRRRTVAKLLRAAAGDGDYPQADALLAAIESSSAVSLCFCRRGLRRSLGGAAYCPLHRATLPNNALQRTQSPVTPLAEERKRRARRLRR